MSKFISSDSLRSKHFRRLFRLFEAFRERERKKGRSGEGEGEGRRGEAKKETFARKRNEFEKRPFSTQGWVHSQRDSLSMKQQITDHRMSQIYLRQNQNMLHVSQTHELQKRSTRRCDVEASKVGNSKGALQDLSL